MREFQWDAKNRLLAVQDAAVGSESSGTSRTEFTYDGMDRRIRIVEKTHNGSAWTSDSDNVFIWDGTEIVQKRASDGSTIQRNYFSNGFSAHSQSPELVEGTPSAVHHYYYTKDHLGSIREVVASDGTTVEAVYDYSPWGEVTKTGGTGVESDFLYTGHYFHEASDLHLTLYRAYNPELGMWLSRDPIAENGGINLYAYVLNDPINYWDPYGLKINCSKDVRKILDQLAKNSPKAKKIIDQLDKSVNTHNITDTASRPPANVTTGNKKNESNKVGTGSNTYFSSGKHWSGFSSNSILLHELQHAADKDSGTLDRRDLNKNGYPDSEDRAVDTANEYRKKVGEHKRDDYGDTNSDPCKR